MKILYTCRTPLAGVTPRVARLVNKYFKGEHEARILTAGIGPFGCYFEKGRWDKNPRFQYRLGNLDSVIKAIKWADVIHCNANVGAVSLLNTEELRVKYLKKKTWVFQWHGAQCWPFEQVWEKKHYKYVKWAHIGQGWPRDKFFNKFNFRLLPNLVDIEDESLRPLKWEDRNRELGFSPSNLKDKSINGKGVEVVKMTCKDVDLDLISGLSFEDCLRRKQKCTLGIDEVATPFYHLSGLEFLSQGTACVCSFDSFTADNLREATGSETIPFLDAQPDNLEGLVKGALSDKALLQSAGQESRLWMETFYHPKDILSRYFEFYRE